MSTSQNTHWIYFRIKIGDGSCRGPASGHGATIRRLAAGDRESDTIPERPRYSRREPSHRSGESSGPSQSVCRLGGGGMSRILSGRVILFTVSFPMAASASEPSAHRGAVASGISRDGTASRASVGSTEASNGRLARVGRIDRSHLGSIRFGDVGPTRKGTTSPAKRGSPPTSADCEEVKPAIADSGPRAGRRTAGS